MTIQEKIMNLNCLKQYLGEHVTVTYDNYGHEISYSGKLGTFDSENIQSIQLSKEKPQDMGVGLPIRIEKKGIPVLELKRIVRTNDQKQIYPNRKSK